MSELVSERTLAGGRWLYIVAGAGVGGGEGGGGAVAWSVEAGWPG